MRFDNKEVELSINFASNMMLTEGKVVPMVVGITPEGKRHICLVPWQNDREKAETIRQVTKLFRGLGVDKIVFMTEAWGLVVVKEDYEEGTPFPRPSTHPDRVEMVVINYLSHTEKVAVSIPVIRKDKAISLGDPKITMNNDFEDNVFGGYFREQL